MQGDAVRVQYYSRRVMTPADELIAGASRPQVACRIRDERPG